MSKKYVQTFEQWIIEAEDKVKMIDDRIQKKAEMDQKYKEEFVNKLNSAKKNSKMSAVFKKRSADSKSELNKEINANKSMLAQMRVQVRNAEAKVAAMKQKMIKDEVKTLDLEKKKAEAKKSAGL